MICLAPRALEDIVRPRRLADVVVRPLSFTVRGQRMDAPTVLSALEGAFPLKPLPSMSLHERALADQSLSRTISEEERAAASRADAGRTWKEFTDEELIACDAALGHLDDESFVYYLPAFLRFAVRHCNVQWGHPAWPLLGTAIFSVTHHKSDHSLRRYKRLSAAQREAVVSFLEFISQKASPENASRAQKSIARYWKTPKASEPLPSSPNNRWRGP